MKFYISKKLLKKIINLNKELKYFRKSKVIVQNIIYKKNSEIEKIKVELEKQKNINKRKIEFVSHLAHEFKTPLNAIIGFASLLSESSNLDEKQKKYCKNILSASNHLLHLSEYAIDMAWIEVDNLELNYSDFYPHKIVEEVLAILEEKITCKHLLVKTKLSKSLICADKRRFKQLVYNLVGNAIKYNVLGGSICIKTSFDKDVFFFCIKDTGIGISEESQNKVFDIFSNISNSYVCNMECRGIGLSLCKKIVNLHNGEVDFSSQKNVGSEFWFSLPQNIQQVNKNKTSL